MSVLVVGSIALDDIKTRSRSTAKCWEARLGTGCVAASFYSSVNLVGIVGEDFPSEHIEFFKRRNVDLTGLKIAPGKTFRWSGEYMWDLNTRETRSVALNVFEHFTPTLPAKYRKLPSFFSATSPQTCNTTCSTRSDFRVSSLPTRWISG